MADDFYCFNESIVILTLVYYVYIKKDLMNCKYIWSFVKYFQVFMKYFQVLTNNLITNQLLSNEFKSLIVYY